MALTKFGELQIDTQKIIYTRRFLPTVHGLGPERQGGVHIGFEPREITLYDDDPGFTEFIEWLDHME